LGDVGGTNVRLTLRRLNLKTRKSIELKALTKIPSQGVKRFEEAVHIFLKVITSF
jgi:glucokinase